jgi:hypothetical protein
VVVTVGITGVLVTVAGGVPVGVAVAVAVAVAVFVGVLVGVVVTVAVAVFVGVFVAVAVAVVVGVSMIVTFMLAAADSSALIGVCSMTLKLSGPSTLESRINGMLMVRLVWLGVKVRLPWVAT